MSGVGVSVTSGEETHPPAWLIFETALNLNSDTGLMRWRVSCTPRPRDTACGTPGGGDSVTTLHELCVHAHVYACVPFAPVVGTP